MDNLIFLRTIFIIKSLVGLKKRVNPIRSVAKPGVRSKIPEITMNKQSKIKPKDKAEFVDKKELNLWKRGFTPQAEIWNGRMATVGIALILIIIAVISKFSSI